MANFLNHSETQNDCRKIITLLYKPTSVPRPDVGLVVTMVVTSSRGVELAPLHRSLISFRYMCRFDYLWYLASLLAPDKGTGS